MKVRVLFWLKIIVSVGLLSYLLILIGLDHLLQQLRNLDVRYLALALVLLLAQISWQWQLILRSDGLAMRLPFLFKTNLIGGFVSLFLPTISAVTSTG